jgi:hypothetical protein
VVYRGDKPGGENVQYSRSGMRLVRNVVSRQLRVKK